MIISVTLTSESAGKTASELTASRVYQVKTNNTSSTVEVQGSGHASLPVVGDVHPDDAGLYVKSVTVNRVQDSQRHFTYEAQYSDIRDAQQYQASASPNPLNWHPRVQWGGSESSAPYFIDAEGTHVVNSAGDLPEDMPERDTSEQTATVTIYQAAYDNDIARQYTNAVNSDAFTLYDGYSSWSIPAGAAKLGTISCSELQIIGGYEVYEITYPLKLREDGWDDVFLDVGYYEISGGEKTEILDKAGKPVKQPYPLDGSGSAKSSPTDDAAELTFVPYDELPFSNLDMG